MIEAKQVLEETESCYRCGETVKRSEGHEVALIVFNEGKMSIKEREFWCHCCWISPTGVGNAKLGIKYRWVEE